MPHVLMRRRNGKLDDPRDKGIVLFGEACALIILGERGVMVRPRNTKAKVQQTKAAVVYAPSAVSQHGNFMNIGVVVVSCTSAIWGDIPLFRVALQRVIGLNNYQFRRVRGDQFI